jgi:hypothetical protein
VTSTRGDVDPARLARQPVFIQVQWSPRGPAYSLVGRCPGCVGECHRSPTLPSHPPQPAISSRTTVYGADRVNMW